MKKRFGFFAVTLLFLISCSAKPQSDLGWDEQTIEITHGEIAREHLEEIAGGIGHREPGSAGEEQAAQYIQNAFEGMGFSPEIQEFSFYDEEPEETIQSSNIIATKAGLSDEIIVVGAHYDSTDDADSAGADDNASGVAVMLEVAESVADLDTPYTVQFIAFGSEEIDLDGSNYFVDNLSKNELQKIIGMINLDSLIAGDKTYAYGNTGPGSMRDWILEDADQQDFNIEGKTARELNNEDGSPCDCADYDPFEEAGIPFIYFEATNWDLSPDAMIQVDPQYGDEGEIRHTEYDTIEYIDDTFPGRIDHHLNLFVTLVFDLLTQFK
jgi:alkaline phosphatase isozyme conversion protein